MTMFFASRKKIFCFCQLVKGFWVQLSKENLFCGTNCETCMYIYVHWCCGIALYKVLPPLLPLLSSYVYVCFSFTTLNNSVVRASSPSNRWALIQHPPPFIVLLCLALPSFNDHRQRGVLKDCYLIQLCSCSCSSSSSSLSTFSTPLLLGSYSLLIIHILQCRRMATNVVVRVSGL